MGSVPEIKMDWLIISVTEISIDCCRAGTRQQLRAVPRCQPTYEAQHGLVFPRICWLAKPSLVFTDLHSFLNVSDIGLLCCRPGQSEHYWHCRIICGAGSMKWYGVRPSVCPSVPAWASSRKPVAAGLLLWARRAGDINRLLRQRQRRSTGEFGQCHVVSLPL